MSCIKRSTNQRIYYTWFILILGTTLRGKSPYFVPAGSGSACRAGHSGRNLPRGFSRGLGLLGKKGLYYPRFIRMIIIIEGSLEVIDRWKSRGGESQRGEEPKREDQRRERVRRKKMQVRKRVGKSRNTVFFQWFVAPEGRKVGSLKRRVRSHVVRWEMKSCTPLWREAHFEVNMYKTHHSRTTFGSCDVEKVHAFVARSTLRKSKCTKHIKTQQPRSIFGRWDVEKVQAIVVRSTFRSQKWKKPEGYWALLDVQMSFRVAGAGDCAPCQKWARRWGFCSSFSYNHHYTTLHYTTLHYTTLRYTTLHPATTTTTTHYATPITLDSTRLHYTMVHYTTLNYITLHYKTTLHYTHYTTLRYTTLHCTTLHHTTLHYTTPHDTTLHYILHYTTLHYTLHYTTLRYTTTTSTITLH